MNITHDNLIIGNKYIEKYPRSKLNVNLLLIAFCIYNSEKYCIFYNTDNDELYEPLKINEDPNHPDDILPPYIKININEDENTNNYTYIYRNKRRIIRDYLNERNITSDIIFFDTFNEIRYTEIFRNNNNVPVKKQTRENEERIKTHRREQFESYDFSKENNRTRNRNIKLPKNFKISFNNRKNKTYFIPENNNNVIPQNK
jgi:hypothetical protein